MYHGETQRGLKSLLVLLLLLATPQDCQLMKQLILHVLHFPFL